MNKITDTIFYFLSPIARRFEFYLRTYNHKRQITKFKKFGDGSSLGFPNAVTNAQYISIGKNFSSLWNLRIEAWDKYAHETFMPQIIIGDDVHVNSDVHIGCINKIVIGNNVLIASRVYITDHAHGDTTTQSISIVPVKRPLLSKGAVVIEDNVWIGEGVCILPGVTIGANSIIGANAVVTKSIPANCVAGGVPAVVLKTIQVK